MRLITTNASGYLGHEEHEPEERYITDNRDIEDLPLWPAGMELDRKTGRLISNDGLRDTGKSGYREMDEPTLPERTYADDEDGPLMPTGFNYQGICLDCD